MTARPNSTKAWDRTVPPPVPPPVPPRLPATVGSAASIRTIRKPLLVWLGAAGLAVDTIGHAVGSIGQAADSLGQAAGLPAELLGWVGEMGARAHDGYLELAGRGQEALNRFTARPSVSRALRGVEEAGREFDGRLQYAVDELNDLSEEALGRMSEQTWQLRERALQAAGSAIAVNWAADPDRGWVANGWDPRAGNGQDSATDSATDAPAGSVEEPGQRTDRWAAGW